MVLGGDADEASGAAAATSHGRISRGGSQTRGAAATAVYGAGVPWLPAESQGKEAGGGREEEQGQRSGFRRVAGDELKAAEEAVRPTARSRSRTCVQAEERDGVRETGGERRKGSFLIARSIPSDGA